ncbi:hypothetical protein [Dokdonia sp.]|uniref:hypothetical protein n=1 Tax=Dokdonia sp. TaxID=2024995 RepID=UPI0032656967
MNIPYLFPNRFKKIGWILFIPAAILGIYILKSGEVPAFFETSVLAFIHESFINSDSELISNYYFEVIENNILDEILVIITIIGALFIAFSKEKHEDEYINKIRLNSLVWATYVNYSILIISTIFVYNATYFWVMLLNMFTILIIFIVRFNWQLIKLKKEASYEE